jgi:hypothetical protein
MSDYSYDSTSDLRITSLKVWFLLLHMTPITIAFKHISQTIRLKINHSHLVQQILRGIGRQIVCVDVFTCTNLCTIPQTTSSTICMQARQGSNSSSDTHYNGLSTHFCKNKSKLTSRTHLVSNRTPNCTLSRTLHRTCRRRPLKQFEQSLFLFH